LQVPRFYFHTEDGKPLRDRHGVDLPDMDAARRAATHAFCEILKDNDDFWADGAFRMTVADEAGLTLFVLEVTATMAAAVS
jgi:hypothetical protein